ncbi:MAG: hypothetical protein ABIP51_10380 [Bacteroidia bacterium]
MAQLLNKKIIFLLSFLTAVFFMAAQEGNDYQNSNDYKDPKQFEKFRKRRVLISAWQINQLKENGALVVKLKTSQKQINALNQVGKTQEATEKKTERFINNKNIMMGYLDNFKFCKIYFIYSNSNDSLLNGARSGIFLDTNLKINPAIVMNEKFYLVAEEDFAYNSSIGFVKEDSAKFVSEHGNPTGGMYDIVIKNKFGHQLKHPFPYTGYFGKISLANVGSVPMYYKYEENIITYTVDKTQLEDMRQTEGKKFKPQPTGYKTFMLKGVDLYEYVKFGVTRLNDSFDQFYQSHPKPDDSKISPDIKKLLY